MDKAIKCQIMATTVPGLESVAESQIQEMFPDCAVGHSQRGKIFFGVDSSLGQLLKIKCADNLYFFIKQFPIGATKNDLCELKKELAKIPYASFLSPVCDAGRLHSVYATASRSGKHSFSRFDVAKAALEALSSLKCFKMGDAESHDLHFRIDVVDDTAYFSLKITSEAYRYRGGRRFVPGAIRPSIANSLIWLSRPDKKDVFLDPFCGSGTIAAERERYAHRKILAFDNQHSAVEIAKNNVSEKIIVRQGDACKLPLGDGCIDAIVTNLPWDVQVPSDDIYKLYRDFLREASRVLKSGGRMVLLTDKEDAVRQAVCGLGVEARRLLQLSLHGLHPAVFAIDKKIVI